MPKRIMVDLHSHDCGSIRDSIATPEQNASRAKEMGSDAVAVTNHGTMLTVPKHIDACCKHGIKPIIGVEMYETDNRMETDHHYHFLLIALNKGGYRNLMEIVSDANLKGFKRKPRTDETVYTRLGKGILASSGCLASRIPRYIQKGELDKARQWALKMRDTFEMFVMEIQINDVPLQRSVNKEVIKIAQELGIDLIVTGDTHYARKEDKKAHDILEENYGIPYQGNTYYPRTDEEIIEKAVSQGIERDVISGAITNTNLIAQRVEQFEIYKGKDDPYILPDVSNDAQAELKALVQEGFERKMVGKPVRLLPVYADRLKRELEVIYKLGFEDYFLIVADYLKYAKSQGIPVAPARGSSAGSLVCYMVDITEVDSIEHGLLFERFLDETRPDMPDIDSDVADARRYEVIDYLIEKYGKDKVAQVANHIFMKGRSAIKPVLKTFGVPFKESQAIADIIPDKTSLQDFKDDPIWNRYVPTIKDGVEGQVQLKEILEIALKFEGVISSVGKHAGGVIITPDEIWNHFPLRTSDGYPLVEYNKKEIARIGGVKFDLLGLSTLSIIESAVDIIKEQHGIEIDIYSITKDMTDEKVFQLFRAGDTSTIFQFGADGLGNYTKSVQPETFEHLVACTSMYRPAVLANGDAFEFVKRMRGEAWEGENDVLAETYGILAYQEQTMQLVHKYAGWTLGFGDSLRKKSAEELEELRDKFVFDCNTDEAFAEMLWDKIVEGAGYGFNKSHAVSYTMISYITAWLKVHYPLEWYCANLTAEIGNDDEMSRLVTELKRREIEFILPRYNVSVDRFTPVDGKIAFPAYMIKGMGAKAVEALEELKDVPLEQYFQTLAESKHLKLNIGHVFTLIQLGVFGENREEVLEHYLSTRKGSAKVKEAERERYQKMSKPIAELEKEHFGMYISEHPLDKFFFRPLTHFENGQLGLLGGTLIKVKHHTDKTGGQMAFLSLETQYGIYEGVCFRNDWKKLSDILVKGSLVKIYCKRDGDKFIANGAEKIE